MSNTPKAVLAVFVVTLVYLILMLTETVYVNGETKRDYEVIFTNDIVVPESKIVVGPDGRIMATTTLTEEEMKIQETNGCVSCHPK